MRRVPFPPNIELFNFLSELNCPTAQSPFQFAFFATVQLKHSRWCWWPGGWLLLPLRFCATVAYGGRFFFGGSRMLELREMFFQFEAAQSPLSACLRLKSYPVSFILNRRGSLPTVEILISSSIHWLSCYLWTYHCNSSLEQPYNQPISILYFWTNRTNQHVFFNCQPVSYW